MKRWLLLLAGWAFALPAWAEGGSMYPPEGIIVLLLFAGGLGIPLALAGLAIGLAKLLRPARQRLGPVFWAAWLPWVAGMVALVCGFDLGMSENQQCVCWGLVSFTSALAVALRTGQRRPENRP